MRWLPLPLPPSYFPSSSFLLSLVALMNIHDVSSPTLSQWTMKLGGVSALFTCVSLVPVALLIPD